MIMEFFYGFMEAMDFNDKLTIYSIFTRWRCSEKSFPITVNAVF